MKKHWLNHIRAERIVAFPRDYGLWRRKLLTQQQYLTACTHAHENKLELYTSVYGDYEVANQLVTELFYDIDVEHIDTPRSTEHISDRQIMIDHDHNIINLKTQSRQYSSSRPDVVELIAQLEPIVNVVRSLYSGRRGVHLHVDLNPVRVIDLRRAAEYVAELLGIADIVDKQVLGDWRRISRVPGSYHKLTGNECVLLNPSTDTELTQLLTELLHERFTVKTHSYTVPLSSEVRETAAVLGEPPPCISFLLGQLQAGQTLTHEGRLHLGAYLIRIGLKPEEAAVLYSRLPDYDVTTTSYQLQWICRHNYKMYSCAKAKQYGLCPLPVEECRYAPSPNWWL
jgi:hypothetical protein